MDSASDSEDGFSEMPTRPMRIKVLYTFDTDSKVNCLARFSETLQIPVVQIDDTAHVGVIALHKCLHSVVSASPELSTAANDFAIYAHDYSEQDTPLVGQGMLSAVLATRQHHTGPMITGRVCQNVPAIFSNGVKETLEVKLRLTPVASTINNRMKSMNTSRTATPATSAGFDPNAWNNSMQQMRPIEGIEDMFNFDDLATSEEDLAGMLALDEQQEVGVAGTLTDPIFHTGHPSFAVHSHSAPGSRTGTPNSNSDYGSRHNQLRHQSFSVNSSHATEQPRPGSRGSTRSEYQHLQQYLPTREQSEQTSPNYEEFQDEDGQARKRAKITQTDWRGRSSFGGRSSDLRVTAATTASMQMHRPVPTRPFAPGSNLEPPPRVPTPVPRGNLAPNRRGRPPKGPRSSLREASTLTSDFVSDAGQLSDAIASSPDDDSPGASANGTPLDLPSSPPVFPGLMQMQSRSPRQSAADSGYMSERNHLDQFGMGSESCSPEFDTAALPEPGYFPYQHLSNNDRRIHDQRNTYPQHPQTQMSSRANSPFPNLAPAQTRGARLNSSTRRSSLVLPTTTARPSINDDSDLPAQCQHSRSQHVDSEAGSPAPSETGGRPTGLKRSGSGAPRRKIIEQRLHTAVAKGEMPQYCSHCGAIETPTWRRLYVKYVNGKPSPLDSVEGEGETIGIEELEYDDETGDVTKFVIRKSMKRTKDFRPGKGFQDTQICNSCGLWFAKMRSMRPKDKWGRRSGTRKSRKKTAGSMTDGAEPQSEACYTDAAGPDAVVGHTVRPQLKHADTNMTWNTSADSYEDAVEAQQARRSSGEQHALDRMTRSSPVKVGGTQESPIELDDRTPKPTRRLLFPSPRQEGVTKALNDGERASKSVSSEKHIAQNTNVSIFGAFQLDKENIIPTLHDDDDDFSRLLAGSPSALFKTPQKAVRRSPRTNKLLESPVAASPSSRKRKAVSAAGLPGPPKASTHDFMTSPASSRYFLRSTPTRLAATPGRRSQNNDAHDVSPFSRQLAAMLGDDGPMVFTSPGQAFAFSDLPNFTSPNGPAIDWDNLDLMGSDFAEFDGGEQASMGDS